MIAVALPCVNSQPQSNAGAWMLGTTPITRAQRKNAVAITKSSSVSATRVDARVEYAALGTRCLSR